jgi:hypothetical protein
MPEALGGEEEEGDDERGGGRRAGAGRPRKVAPLSPSARGADRPPGLLHTRMTRPTPLDPGGQSMGSDLRFGPLGPQAVHLCVDMQTLFAERTDWHVPWLLPPVTRLAQAPRERTVFTRLCRPNGQKMPWARGGVILRTGAR